MFLQRSDRLHLAIGAALLLCGLAYGFGVKSLALLDAGIYLAYFVLLAGSWNLLGGYTGQFSFAHMAMATIGAYMVAWFNLGLGLPVWLALAGAGLGAAAAGLVLGLLTLRFRSIYLGLSTFAFSGVFLSWAMAATSITGGSNGLILDPLFSGDQTRAFYWLGLVLVLVFYVLQALILSSRYGLFAQAIRDRETVASGLGVRTVQVKVLAFVYTAFWAGLAGGFIAIYAGIVSPAMGTLSNMGLVVAMVVVGGVGHPYSALVGALLFRAIDYQTSGMGGEYTILIFSTVMLLVMLYARDGLLVLAQASLARLLGPRQRWQAETSGRPSADAKGHG